MSMDQDLAYLDATIADLEARRDHLNGMIESLKQIREQGAAPTPIALGATSSMASSPGREVKHDSFFGMTLLDGIKKYLAMTKQTESAPDIAEALVRGGMKSAAKDFVGNVRTTLSKNDEFVSVKNGEWGLSAWYPAKRRETKVAAKGKPSKQSTKKPHTQTAPPKDKLTPTVKLTPKDKSILAYVNSTSGPVKPDLVASALGLNINTTRAGLWRLMKSGGIQHAKSGGYEALAGKEGGRAK
ncbi:MAG TPA: hypothetical protein VNV82_26755 [Bryobacteraceae bacterium]|nr:hypothetical protein [Bryobacteraceae bacterium]